MKVHKDIDDQVVILIAFAEDDDHPNLLSVGIFVNYVILLNQRKICVFQEKSLYLILNKLYG